MCVLLVFSLWPCPVINVHVLAHSCCGASLVGPHHLLQHTDKLCALQSCYCLGLVTCCSRSGELLITADSSYFTQKWSEPSWMMMFTPGGSNWMPPAVNVIIWKKMFPFFIMAFYLLSFQVFKETFSRKWKLIPQLLLINRIWHRMTQLS